MLNRVSLIGNLTADPELKALPSGMPVANFSLACNREYKDKDGIYQDAVDFVNCVVFGNRAEAVASHKRKGDLLFCEGRMSTRSWEKDGVKHYRTEVVLSDVKFLGGKKDSPVERPKRTDPTPTKAEQVDLGQPEYPDSDIKPEDIPF